jgi:hypothetical protein
MGTMTKILVLILSVSTASCGLSATGCALVAGLGDAYTDVEHDAETEPADRPDAGTGGDTGAHDGGSVKEASIDASLMEEKDANQDEASVNIDSGATDTSVAPIVDVGTCTPFDGGIVQIPAVCPGMPIPIPSIYMMEVNEGCDGLIPTPPQCQCAGAYTCACVGESICATYARPFIDCTINNGVVVVSCGS